MGLYTHTHTHTSNSIREIKGTKAFSYNTKNKWAIKNNCSFNVRKNKEKSHQSILITNHSGITLVALVVTIVVLLILASVSITSLLGDDGIISKANKVSELTKKSIIIENIQIDILVAQLEGDITQEKLEEILGQYGEVQYDEEGNITGIKVEGIDEIISIEDLYTGELGEEIQDIIPPTATINPSTTNTTTGTEITATVGFADNESGVNVTSCKYIYNTTNGTLGTTDESWNSATSFSSNPEIITLTANTAGTYYLHVLTVDNGGNMSEAVSQAITVRQLVTGISVSPSSVTLEEGQTRQLTATISPGNASNKGVTWSSSSTSIATVSSSGVVTAKAEGTATITVTAQDGSDKKATCKVTVESAGLSASDIASNPANNYGKTVTGYEAEYGNVVGWKIFYAGNEFSSDGSYHVYLIADNYIPRENIPQSSGGHSLNAGSYPRAAYFTNILGDYSGSSSITNAQIKKLNNDYFTKNYSSTYRNMIAVAYMLDTNAWSTYKGSNADYAVGGPSIEMIMKSYSQKHGVDYRAQASGAKGYQISNNGGSSWANHISGMLSTSDSLYVITSTSNAYGYWVASPSTSGTDRVVGVYYSGYVYYYDYDNGSLRFPPPSLSKL